MFTREPMVQPKEVVSLYPHSLRYYISRLSLFMHIFVIKRSKTASFP